MANEWCYPKTESGINKAHSQCTARTNDVPKGACRYGKHCADFPACSGLSGSNRGNAHFNRGWLSNSTSMPGKSARVKSRTAFTSQGIRFWSDGPTDRFHVRRPVRDSTIVGCSSLRKPMLLRKPTPGLICCRLSRSQNCDRIFGNMSVGG